MRKLIVLLLAVVPLVSGCFVSLMRGTAKASVEGKGGAAPAASV